MSSLSSKRYELMINGELVDTGSIITEPLVVVCSETGFRDLPVNVTLIAFDVNGNRSVVAEPSSTNYFTRARGS
jgi:hypothetical protein